MTSIIARKLSFSYPSNSTNSKSLRKELLGIFGRRRVDKNINKSLSNITFEINAGECVGLYGPNGSGKSTLLRVLAGIYPVNTSELQVNGDINCILGLGIGTSYDLSAYDNIRILLEIDEIAVTKNAIKEIWSFTELDDFYLSSPLRTFSSGMLMRLLFSVATFRPKPILLMDEWLSVVDEKFKHKAEDRMIKFTQNSDILVIASHDMALLQRVCNKVFYLENGSITRIEEVS